MRDVKKAVISIVIILTIALNIDGGAVFEASAFDPGIETIYSDSVFMVHLETEIPVFRRNEFERVVPASTTKIMTALLVLDHVDNLHGFVRVTDDMNHRFQSNRNFDGAQAADIQIGQTNLTYMDCLYALMLWSACDVANILAYSVGGTIDNFIVMMNDKAAEIGAVNTNFTNPHGLHEKDNYTCAYDMFKITQYAYEKHPLFTEIVSTRDYRMPANSRNLDGEVLPNTNRMLIRASDYYYEPVIGVKTGSLKYLYDIETSEVLPGLFNLVSIATRDAHTYMIVSLGAPYYDEPYNRGFFTYTDHLALFRWAFSSLEYRLILPENDIIAQGGVRDGLEDRIQMRPAREFSYLLPNNLDRNAIHREITINWHDEEEKVFFAPIERGEILGYVELMLAGEVLTRINLIAVSDVTQSIESRLFERVDEFFFGTKRSVVDSAGERVVDEEGNPAYRRGFPIGLTLSLVIVVLVFFVIVLRVINNQRELNRRRAARSRGGRNFRP
jgi:D-alanyl-D-alanine carboxypeptidase (penicillin-binding protein 5/6)